MARSHREGPKAVALKLCRNVIIRDLTIENSPNYNISLLGCDFVDISGVTIRNGFCDGIDPDCCRDVRISNCFVECWDDAIVPKSSPALGYLRATEHVTVTNCVVTTACNGLKLGTESSGGFKDIAFSNCTIFSSPERWQGRRATSGISLETVDGGPLERVVVSNITMRDVRAPLFVRLGNRGRAQKIPAPEFLRDISISDIVATGAALSSSIMGIEGSPIRDMALRNIQIRTRGGGSPELALKQVPEKAAEYPDASRFGDLPAYGLYCRHVEGLSLDGLRLQFEQFEGRPAIVLDDIKNADLRLVAAQPPQGSQSVVRLHNVREGLVQGCRALSGTGTWGTITGEQTERIQETGNDFSAAARGIELGAEVGAGAIKSQSAGAH
jgi:Glycosyl hydrolases family 28